MSDDPHHQAMVGARPPGGGADAGRFLRVRRRPSPVGLLRRRLSPALTPAGRIARLAGQLAIRTPAAIEDPFRTLAAVAVILVPDPEAVLLIRRADREGDRWSGHMAFPGGRWSPGDSDLLATARRETHEEVGVDLSEARLLGQFDDLAPRTPTLPPVIVRPFVLVLESRQPLVPNGEVAGARWTPLDELFEPGVYRPFEFELGGTRMLLPGYHLDQGLVWGMTERILTPLLSLGS